MFYLLLQCMFFFNMNLQIQFMECLDFATKNTQHQKGLGEETLAKIVIINHTQWNINLQVNLLDRTSLCCLYNLFDRCTPAVLMLNWKHYKWNDGIPVLPLHYEQVYYNVKKLFVIKAWHCWRESLPWHCGFKSQVDISFTHGQSFSVFKK